MAMNRRLHDFSLAQETMPFGFRNRFIAFAFLCFCGCAFPKEQTRYKAKVLKEQGQNAAAQRLEAQAESQPDLIIGTTPSEYSIIMCRLRKGIMLFSSQLQLCQV